MSKTFSPDLDRAPINWPWRLHWHSMLFIVTISSRCCRAALAKRRDRFNASRSFRSAPTLCGRSITKPELRADAPSPNFPASTRATVLLGFISAALRAAAKPAAPAPITNISTRISVVRGGEDCLCSNIFVQPFVRSWFGRRSIFMLSPICWMDGIYNQCIFSFVFHTRSFRQPN